MAARLICSRHQVTSFLQSASEQLENCHVGMGGHRKDGPATPPAFDRNVFAGLSVTRRIEYSKHRVFHLVLPPSPFIPDQK